MNEKPIIILDVDETLVITNNIKENNNLLLTKIINNNIKYYVYKRPFLENFIININKYFDIYIYSLGTIDYINNILDNIAKLIGFYPFKKVIANDNNSRNFIKTLDKFNIDLNKILIVDDRFDVWIDDFANVYNIKKYNNVLELRNDDNLFLSMLNSINISDKQIKKIDDYIRLYDIYIIEYDTFLLEDNELFKLNEIINKYFQLYNEFNINNFKNLIYKLNYDYIIHLME